MLTLCARPQSDGSDSAGYLLFFVCINQCYDYFFFCFNDSTQIKVGMTYNHTLLRIDID